jgi:(p)ppGpp synthase/HD superfamily hydrolase
MALYAPLDQKKTMNLAFKAMMFAREVHKDQKRKYTNNPYVDHLAEVAGIAMTVAPSVLISPEVFLAVSWLHDSAEDQGVTFEEISNRFGQEVMHGVKWLTDLEEGTRAERKAASRARLANAPGWVQTIKCADVISNTSSIVMHDLDFAVGYLEEKRLLLDVLTTADPHLLEIAHAQAQVLLPRKRAAERDA